MNTNEDRVWLGYRVVDHEIVIEASKDPEQEPLEVELKWTWRVDTIHLLLLVHQQA